MQKGREQFLLFRIYRHRDERAYGEIYTEHVQRIHRYLSFKLPTDADADELTADVFLKVWQYLQTSRVDNLSALLFRIARNTCVDFYRARGKAIQEVELKMDVADTREPLRQLEEKEFSLEKIEESLRRLKDDYRDVVIMRYLEEMSIREIALALERSENATRVLLHRALKALRRIIDQEMDEG